MSKERRGLGLGFMEKAIHDRENWEAGREARINRGKLDSQDVFIYVMGPVLYERGRERGKEAVVSLYAYDLLALKELWQEDGGLLVPREGAGLSRDNWGTNEGLKVRPYLTVLSGYSEQQEVLEKAVSGRLEIEYSDKPMDDTYLAGVFSNSLFDADGIGMVRLSSELRPDLAERVNLIKCFYDRLKERK